MRPPILSASRQQFVMSRLRTLVQVTGIKKPAELCILLILEARQNGSVDIADWVEHNPDQSTKCALEAVRQSAPYMKGGTA